MNVFLTRKKLGHLQQVMFSTAGPAKLEKVIQGEKAREVRWSEEVNVCGNVHTPLVWQKKCERCTKPRNFSWALKGFLNRGHQCRKIDVLDVFCYFKQS